MRRGNRRSLTWPPSSTGWGRWRAGTSHIQIKGVEELGAGHEVMPDRIEMGTPMAAGAITRGRLTKRCPLNTDGEFFDKVAEMGIELSRRGARSRLPVKSTGRRTYGRGRTRVRN